MLLCDIAVLQASQIQRTIEYYEDIINRIMFREFKRLSKLKMINYKTINSRNNRAHITKFSKEDSDRDNTSAPKTSEGQFYYTFSAPKFTYNMRERLKA